MCPSSVAPLPRSLPKKKTSTSLLALFSLSRLFCALSALRPARALSLRRSLLARDQGRRRKRGKKRKKKRQGEREGSFFFSRRANRSFDCIRFFLAIVLSPSSVLERFPSPNGRRRRRRPSRGSSPGSSGRARRGHRRVPPRPRPPRRGRRPRPRPPRRRARIAQGPRQDRGRPEGAAVRRADHRGSAEAARRGAM